MVTLNSGNNLTFFRHTGKEFHIQHHKCKFSKFRPLYVRLLKRQLGQLANKDYDLWYFIHTLELLQFELSWCDGVFSNCMSFRIIGS